MKHYRSVLAGICTLLAMAEMLHVKADTCAPAASQINTQGATMTAVGLPIAVTHGLVQVSVTMDNGKITNVNALQLPHDNNHSWQNSNRAAAILRSEVLTAQSADVDAVSGATYTSDAYLKSLQAALDAAHS